MFMLPKPFRHWPNQAVRNTDGLQKTNKLFSVQVWNFLEQLPSQTTEYEIKQWI